MAQLQNLFEKKPWIFYWSIEFIDWSMWCKIIDSYLISHFYIVGHQQPSIGPSLIMHVCLWCLWCLYHGLQVTRMDDIKVHWVPCVYTIYLSLKTSWDFIKYDVRMFCIFFIFFGLCSTLYSTILMFSLLHSIHSFL